MWLKCVQIGSVVPITIEALVPTMTSDTTPSGQVLHTSAIAGARINAFNVFSSEVPTDGFTAWWGTSYNGYIGYKFDEPKTLKKIIVYPFYEDNICKWYSCTLQGSNDGSSWETLGTYQCQRGSASLNHTIVKNSFDVNNERQFLYYRIVGERENGSGHILINRLQFYGY